APLPVHNEYRNGHNGTEDPACELEQFTPAVAPAQAALGHADAMAGFAIRPLECRSGSGRPADPARTGAGFVRRKLLCRGGAVLNGRSYPATRTAAARPACISRIKPPNLREPRRQAGSVVFQSRCRAKVGRESGPPAFSSA